MFVVVDIKTTGLNPVNNLILEAGIAICDDSLEVQEQFSYVCGLPDKPNMSIEVYSMHQKSGLLEEVLKSPYTFQDVEQKLVEFLTDLGVVEEPMCGSSVHFDRGFLKIWMPRLESLFHYRNIDVSTIKNLAERWNPEVFNQRPEGRKLHRSLPDCEDTIAELLYYQENFFFLGEN